MPRLLPTILSFKIEAFAVRNSDISPYEADRRKSRPIHHEAHLLFVECIVTMESGRRVWGNEFGPIHVSFLLLLEFRHCHGREEALATFRQAPAARNYRISRPHHKGLLVLLLLMSYIQGGNNICSSVIQNSHHYINDLNLPKPCPASIATMVDHHS